MQELLLKYPLGKKDEFKIQESELLHLHRKSSAGVTDSQHKNHTYQLGHPEEPDVSAVTAFYDFSTHSDDSTNYEQLTRFKTDQLSEELIEGISGLHSFQLGSTFCSLKSVWLPAEHRGYGYEKGMLDAIVRKGQERGASYLFLYADVFKGQPEIDADWFKELGFNLVVEDSTDLEPALLVLFLDNVKE